MPNVITPNSDNFNERFVPMNYYRVDVARLSVYNRWGQMIFETEDVTKGWDCGDTPPGVYYWALKYLGSNGKEYFQKGFVQVLH